MQRKIHGPQFKEVERNATGLFDKKIIFYTPPHLLAAFKPFVFNNTMEGTTEGRRQKMA